MCGRDVFGGAPAGRDTSRDTAGGLADQRIHTLHTLATSATYGTYAPVATCETTGSVVQVTIDPYANTPVYKQLAAILRARISSGELARLDPLPSEKTLQQEHGVGRDTVRRAVAMLRDEGLVFRVHVRSRPWLR